MIQYKRVEQWGGATPFKKWSNVPRCDRGAAVGPLPVFDPQNKEGG